MEQTRFEQELTSLFEGDLLDFESLSKSMAQMRSRYPTADVFRAMFYLTVHLDFGEQEATDHFDRLKAHYMKLCGMVARPLDIRVSMLDYFLDVNRRISSPKIIEMRVFQNAQSQLIRDELTGLYNYRHFKEVLTTEHTRTSAGSELLSLVIADIDNFKQVNDVHGHLAGDQVLKEMAARIEKAVGRRFYVFRYGGEEFAMIVPQLSKVETRQLVESVRKAVASNPVIIPRNLSGDQVELAITASFGIATIPGDATELESLIQRADKALYVAKAGGKNTVRLYSDNMRNHVRMAFKTKMWVQHFRAIPMEVETQDISFGGVQFETSAKISPDDVFRIELIHEGERRAFDCKAVQVRQNGVDAERFQVGVRFMEATREDRDFITKMLNAGLSLSMKTPA